MWHTSEGDRTLTGPEARLIRAAIADMVDTITQDVELDEVWPFNVELFDDLRPIQRLALLAEVGEALLGPEVPPPELTAVNEAAVAAIFEAISQAVEMEIDEFGYRNDGTFWRSLLLACFEDSPDDPLPRADCAETSEWDPLLDAQESTVLWDRDFDDGGAVLDLPPDEAADFKNHFNIADDYYTAVPPDPAEEELPAIRERLRAIVADAD